MVKLLDKPEHILYHAKINSQEAKKAIELTREHFPNLSFLTKYEATRKINLLELLKETYSQKIIENFEKLGTNLRVYDIRGKKRMYFDLESSEFPNNVLNKKIHCISVYNNENKEELFALWNSSFIKDKKEENLIEKENLTLVIPSLEEKALNEKRIKLTECFLQKL